MTLQEAKETYDVTKSWQVMINNKPYQCYRIAGLKHQFGEWNHQDPEHWIDFDGELIHYDESINRICWDVKFSQRNTTKVKWGEYRLRSHTSYALIADGVTVYANACRDLNYAMAKTQVLMVEVCEHPFNFMDLKGEEGRKIFYKGLPATISVRPSQSQGIRISVKPDAEDLDDWWGQYTKMEVAKADDPSDESWIYEGIREMREGGDFLYGSPYDDNNGSIDWFRG